MVEKYSRKTDGNKSLSKNFKVAEFACKDGSDYILIDTELVKLLQKIRDKFGKSVAITSAYRNSAYNKKVGGVSGSQHTKGTAADIQVVDTAPKLVAEFAESVMPDTGGIGLYGTFVHVDVRAKRSRWQNFGKEVSVSGFFYHETAKDREVGILEEITKLREEIEEIKNSRKVYRYTADLPDYARTTVQKLLDKGIYKGAQEDDLNLSEDIMRLLVVLDRAKIFD